MKNFIKWTLCLLVFICLTTVTVKAQDLPADILSETETHGKKHLRLMEIPPDEEANHKYERGDCFDAYCLSRMTEEKKNCLFSVFVDTAPLPSPCMEWAKGYDYKGKLRTYKLYKIGSDPVKGYSFPLLPDRLVIDDNGVKTLVPQNPDPLFKMDVKYFVEWDENGRIKRILDYDNHIGQYFDPDGKLIKDCYEERGYECCSEYNEDTGKWEVTGFIIA